jgi:hypothetical protein
MTRGFYPRVFCVSQKALRRREKSRKWASMANPSETLESAIRDLPVGEAQAAAREIVSLCMLGVVTCKREIRTELMTIIASLLPEGDIEHPDNPKAAAYWAQAGLEFLDALSLRFSLTDSRGLSEWILEWAEVLDSYVPDDDDEDTLFGDVLGKGDGKDAT